MTLGEITKKLEGLYYRTEESDTSSVTFTRFSTAGDLHLTAIREGDSQDYSVDNLSVSVLRYGKRQITYAGEIIKRLSVAIRELIEVGVPFTSEFKRALERNGAIEQTWYHKREDIEEGHER
jgi:hypothetical protein